MWCRFGRPYGTLFFLWRTYPALETPGYCEDPLRGLARRGAEALLFRGAFDNGRIARWARMKRPLFLITGVIRMARAGVL